MFIRRVFYDANTGVALDAYSMRGNFAYTPQTVDAQIRGFENWVCMEWKTPDPEIEQKFGEWRTYAVNIKTQEIMWGEPGSAIPPPPENPEPDPLDDAVAALETLGYEEEVNG